MRSSRTLTTDDGGARLRRVLVACCVAAAAVLMSGCETMFVYFPRHESEEALRSIAASRGLEPWPTRDAAGASGDEIQAWYGPAPAVPAVGDARDAGDVPATEGKLNARRGRLLVFHGNGAYAVDRIYFVRGFHSVAERYRWDVYLFEYPGYGARPGRPSERTIVDAAEQAARRLLAEEPEQPLFLLGESLGSGVATQVASRMPEAIAGIVLVTPFTNIVDVGAFFAPRFLVQLLIRDRYDSEAALTQYDGPVAFRLAGRDRVVPTSLGRELHEGYHGPRQLRVDESAGHNTVDYSRVNPWWREVTGFLLEHVER